MNKKTIMTGMVMAALATQVFFACKKDEDSCKSTYNTDVKAIIDKNCAYSGCHSGGTTASPFLSAASRNYTNYDSLQASLTNGKFDNRVLVLKNMPDKRFVPSGKPTELTAAEISTLECWKSKNFPR